MDEINRGDDVEDLHPRVSSSGALMSPELQDSHAIRIKTIQVHKELQELRGCDKPDHDICLSESDFVGHSQLSVEQVSNWIDEICRGQATCSYPPEVLIIPGASRSNRDPGSDWGASGTNNDTDGEVGPGYVCGLALERVSKAILSRAKFRCS